jgi:hypothetical protein
MAAQAAQTPRLTAENIFYNGFAAVTPLQTALRACFVLGSGAGVFCARYSIDALLYRSRQNAAPAEAAHCSHNGAWPSTGPPKLQCQDGGDDGSRVVQGDQRQLGQDHRSHDSITERHRATAANGDSVDRSSLEGFADNA